MTLRALPIRVARLTKSYGTAEVVSGLDFRVDPGRVTGFVGPNGAGKTTTIRMILGLVQPTSGQATIGEQRVADIPQPGTVVGAALDGTSAHPGHTGIGHLLAYAPLLGADKARCMQMLADVGLDSAAKQRVARYSYGMRQRLALATALLSDPPVLILDEPTLGLDPDGIAWTWHLLRRLADEGRVVFVSSHSLTELEQAVDDVVVIDRGQLKYAGDIGGLRDQVEVQTFLASPDTVALGLLARTRNWVHVPRDGGILVEGVTAVDAGAAAFEAGVQLTALEERAATLHDSFRTLTGGHEAAAGRTAGGAR
jgi:ABC-2 type transport system ATP-binding protein